MDGVFHGVSGNKRLELGHIHVFKLESYKGRNANHIYFKNRGCFKIILLTGQGSIAYANHAVHVKKPALMFFNSQIPCRWKNAEGANGGYFCIFDQAFFDQFCNLLKYAVFQPGGHHVFELSDQQVKLFDEVFHRMIEELYSDYIHKYDILRIVVSELIHFAMKILPPSSAALREKTLDRLSITALWQTEQ